LKSSTNCCPQARPADNDPAAAANAAARLDDIRHEVMNFRMLRPPNSVLVGDGYDRTHYTPPPDATQQTIDWGAIGEITGHTRRRYALL